MKAALAELLRAEGKEAWRYELPLSSLSGIPLVYLQKLRERPEFAPLIVQTPRTQSKRPKFAWFVDKKIAEEMRNKLKEAL